MTKAKSHAHWQDGAASCGHMREPTIFANSGRSSVRARGHDDPVPTLQLCDHHGARRVGTASGAHARAPTIFANSGRSPVCCPSTPPKPQQPDNIYPGNITRTHPHPHTHCPNRNNGTSHTMYDNHPTPIEQPSATTTIAGSPENQTPNWIAIK
jgi:hypothetical protein